MIRAVLDTNIWLSAVFWDGEASRIIESAENGSVELIISKPIVLEIADVMNKEAKFQRFIEDRMQCTEDLIRTILNICELVESKTKVLIIKEHKADNMLIEAAIDGNADYIVSYDKHVLNLGGFEGIKTITPGEFIRVVSK